MKETIKILYRGGCGEVAEKKSRFIGNLWPVESEEEALAFIEQIKKEHRDANHNCYAYVIGEHYEIQRCSDDGEPSQTAGRPMLDVLLGGDIHNACAVVTRYFGGTLLGTGGLVRAYSGAVQAGLAQCETTVKYPAFKLAVSTDYSDAGKIQHLLAEAELTVLSKEYTDQVTLTVLVPVSQMKRQQERITEMTGARCKMSVLGEVYYALTDGGLVLF